MSNVREKFYDEVCKNCEAFFSCKREKDTQIGCATLIIWNNICR